MTSSEVLYYTGLFYTGNAGVSSKYYISINGDIITCKMVTLVTAELFIFTHQYLFCVDDSDIQVLEEVKGFHVNRQKFLKE